MVEHVGKSWFEPLRLMLLLVPGSHFPLVLHNSLYPNRLVDVTRSNMIANHTALYPQLQMLHQGWWIDECGTSGFKQPKNLCWSNLGNNSNSLQDPVIRCYSMEWREAVALEAVDAFRCFRLAILVTINCLNVSEIGKSHLINESLCQY